MTDSEAPEMAPPLCPTCGAEIHLADSAESDDSLTRDQEADFAEEYANLPETREARVRAIMWLMTSGRFERGRTAKALESTWDLSGDTIRNYTAEASRRVKSTVDAPWVQKRLTVALDAQLDRARLEAPKETAAVARAYAEIAQVVKQGDVTINVTMQNGQAIPIPATDLMAGVYRGANLLPEEMRALFWSGFGGEENGIVVREKV